MEKTNPTAEQIGDFVVTASKLLGKRSKTINKLNITEKQLVELENGLCTDTMLYISFFVLTLRRLVPRKIKMKQLPSTLPPKDKIVEMLNGKCDDLGEYFRLVNALLILPDLPAKKTKPQSLIVYKEKRLKKTQKDWGKEALKKVASEYSLKSYGMESQITRKAWGSAYRPARISR